MDAKRTSKLDKTVIDSAKKFLKSIPPS